jgi:hypothetical protein
MHAWHHSSSIDLFVSSELKRSHLSTKLVLPLMALSPLEKEEIHAGYFYTTSVTVAVGAPLKISGQAWTQVSCISCAKYG